MSHPAGGSTGLPPVVTTWLRRWQVPIAVALILLALGLPWSPSSWQYMPGWITPSFCITTADLTIDCTPGFVQPGYYIGGGRTVGAGSVARVFLVGALIILAFGRGRSRWLFAAAITLLTGLLLHGFGVLGGQLATIGAIVLLAWAARDRGAPDLAEIGRDAAGRVAGVMRQVSRPTRTD